MASIVKRKTSYAVIYNNPSLAGKQVWETFHQLDAAKLRKAQVELSIFQGIPIQSKVSFDSSLANQDGTRTQSECTNLSNAFGSSKIQLPRPNSSLTIEGLMTLHTELHGKTKWGPSTYSANTGLIRNYIIPLMGNIQIQDIDRLYVAKLISLLQKTNPVTFRNRKPTSEYLSAQTIGKIFKLLHCAFKNAVKWGIRTDNPFQDATIPKIKYKSRPAWTVDSVKSALTQCTNTNLLICIHLAFGCSLRLGEILGLTWDELYIDDKHLVNDNAYLVVNKELTRIRLDAIEAVYQNGIIVTFPPALSHSQSRLVLKTPKTDSSNRKVWIPTTLAYYLKEWKCEQAKAHNILGDSYHTYNLVVSQFDGRPVECHNIERAFTQLKKEANLPDVVFHSLRKTSATAKLKWNNGDIKATQGDMGHSEPNMVMKVYSEIHDEDRASTAKKVEDAFYRTKLFPMQNSKEYIPEEKQIVDLLKSNQEIRNLLIDFLMRANT